MRVVQILSIAVFIVGAVALLVWRPATALALAMIGAAISLWRMKRPARAAAGRAAPAREAGPAPLPAPEPPRTAQARPDPVLLERVREAGWSVQPAAMGAPWIVLVREDVRIALRASPRAACAASGDIAEALAAKASETANYVAIVCPERPARAVAAEARLAQVHIVNLPRLEAYLTLASTFQSGARPQVVPA